MAMQIVTRKLLKYNGIGLFNIIFKINPLKGLREFAGTIKRYGKNNKQN